MKGKQVVKSRKPAASNSTDNNVALKPAKSNTPDPVWVTYKKTRDENLRNILIERYMPLVRSISERLLATLPKSIDLDDLTSAGIFGLIDAIDGFDINRGIKFKTYCTTRIRGSILDELRSQDWVPRLVRLKAHRIERTYKTLESRLGRKPTDFEMAKNLELTLRDYGSMVDEATAVNVFSLNEKWEEDGEDNAVNKVDILEDKKSEDPILALNQKDVLEFVTRSLSEKERLILVMYYYEGLTMKEIGEILDLTESRICQIHSSVMERLKNQLKKKRQTLFAG
ncbi:MAG: FliA/WhiG family RNA polymerase sigma factor [Planctomycetes bacterium]|nr:FliA/WhiG family RNA polymerase sigma factor [Planctomycetota bacterium]